MKGLRSIYEPGFQLAKAGVMLRPGGGVSPIQDGRDPYIALTFSPKRGVFAQVRGERSRTEQASLTPGPFLGGQNLV